MADLDVAVVVPVRNGRRTIATTIAALAQEVAAAPGAVEILVVDDASEDDTAAVARAAIARHALAARVLRRPVRGGPNASRNEAAAATSAPVLVFLDGDDTPLPGAITLLAAAVDADGVIAGGSYVVPGRRSRPVTITAGSRSAFGYPYAVGGALATSRTLLDRAGWFDPAIRQGGTELEFCIRAQELAGARIVPVDEARIWHRVPGTLLGRARVHFRRERGHQQIREWLAQRSTVDPDLVLAPSPGTRRSWPVRADQSGGYGLLLAEILGRKAGRLAFSPGRRRRRRTPGRTP